MFVPIRFMRATVCLMLVAICLMLVAFVSRLSLFISRSLLYIYFVSMLSIFVSCLHINVCRYHLHNFLFVVIAGSWACFLSSVKCIPIIFCRGPNVNTTFNVYAHTFVFTYN